MSITELTIASAWVAGLAIVSLIAAGWRKPARASARFPRASFRGSTTAPRRQGIALMEDATPLHRGTPWWRRIVAVIGSSVIGVVVGAVLATVLSFGAAWTVIRLTTMLRR